MASSARLRLHLAATAQRKFHRVRAQLLAGPQTNSQVNYAQYLVTSDLVYAPTYWRTGETRMLARLPDQCLAPIDRMSFGALNGSCIGFIRSMDLTGYPSSRLWILRAAPGDDESKRPIDPTNMAPIGTPLTDSKFTLDSSAVAGFFGGKEAISAMATVHLYKGRRWLGWYNSPGSYTVAKRFGRMANAPVWDGLFPGPNDPPAITFGLDGKKGPEYIAALSGTKMPTGHLAYLMMDKSKDVEADPMKGRSTKPCDVVYLPMKPVDCEVSVERLRIWESLLALIPIASSAVTSVMCALVFDWYSFSMILLGMVSSGLASSVIGKGTPRISSVSNPAIGSPPGHGILKGENGINMIMVIKGEEKDVNVITKGRFVLETDSKESQKEKGDREQDSEKEKQGLLEKSVTKQGLEKKSGEKHYHAIGFCSLLLLAQFLVQLLLVPQGTLFGQIMFIVSLAISWGYNSYLSSLEKEKIQADLLYKTLGRPEMRRFQAGTWTTTVVFVCLLLFHDVDKKLFQGSDCEKILSSLIPNNTTVWEEWKTRVIKQFLKDDDETLLDLQCEQVSDERALSPDECLLRQLLGDATVAFKKYFEIRAGLPLDSSSTKLVTNPNGPISDRSTLSTP